jgi:hypothetical protein
MSPPRYYQIRVGGELTSQWAEWFGGLVIAAQPGDGTLLAGWLPDQAALRGVLDRIFDLNLQLVSVNQINQIDQIAAHCQNAPPSFIMPPTSGG